MANLSELLSTPTQTAAPDKVKGLRSAALQQAATESPFLSTLGGTLQGTVGGGSLTALGNVTGALGLKKASDALYRGGKALQQEAAPYMAPQLSYKTVEDVGSALDFAKANAAQGLGSMIPAIIGRKLGGAPAGLAGSYLPQYGENVSRLKEDPALQGLTEGQIMGAAAPAGALQAGLDYFVPGGLATKLGRSVATQPLSRAGTTLLANMGVEGATETGQEVIGQQMHRIMNPLRDTAGDSEALIQSALGGAVGGAPMGAIDAGVGMLQDKMEKKPSTKPLDISAEVKRHLGTRESMPDNMTSGEQADWLTKRDAADAEFASTLAAEMAKNGTERQKRMAADYAAGPKDGAAHEVFLREARNAVDAEKFVEKGRAAGKALREEISGWFKRLGNAEAPNTSSYLSKEWRALEYRSEHEKPEEGMRKDKAGDVLFHKPAERPSSGGDFSYLPGKVTDTASRPFPEEKIHTDEAIVDNLMLAFRAKDVARRSAAQAQAAMQIKDVSEPLNKWIDTGFGAEFNEGEVLVPKALLKLSDKLDVFVQTLYNNRVKRGEPVPPKEMLDQVIAEINRLESEPQLENQKSIVGQRNEEGDWEQNRAGENIDAATAEEIGTNWGEANTISSRKVYTGKSLKADVPFDLSGKGDIVENTKKMMEEMDKLKAGGVQPKHVGVWQRLKDEFVSNPDQLYQREMDLIKERRPDDYAQLLKADPDSDAFSQRRENILKGLDQHYKYIEHEVNEEAEPSEVRGEQFRNLKKSPWVKQAKGFEGPEHGTVWFRKADGSLFATSVHKLIKLGRKGQSAEAEQGLAEQRDALLSGITSFLNATETDGTPALDGKFGYQFMRDGELSGNTEQLPGDLKLYSGNVSDIKEKSTYTRQPYSGKFNQKFLDKVFEYKTHQETVKDKYGASKTEVRANVPANQPLVDRILSANSLKEKFRLAAELDLRKDAGVVHDRAVELGYSEEAVALKQAFNEAMRSDNPEAWVAVSHEMYELSDLIEKAGLDGEFENSDNQTPSSLEQDLPNIRKPINRTNDGNVATHEPSGKLRTSEMTSQRKEESSKFKDQVAFLFDTLRRGVPNTLDVHRKAKDQAAFVDRLKTVAGLESYDPLWGKFPEEHRKGIKARALSALNSMNEDVEEFDQKKGSQQEMEDDQMKLDTSTAPGFAREKEAAKAEGANWVVAAEGVKGSYASRLAADAKNKGMLLTDAESVKPGDVVYVSVPGDGRDFTFKGSVYGLIPSILDKGGVIRTDTSTRAHSQHNRTGEGIVYDQLMKRGYKVTENDLYAEWKKDIQQEIKDTVDLALADPNDVVWAVVQPKDETEAGGLIAAFRSHAKAQALAEQRGANLVQDTVESLRRGNAEASTPEQNVELTEEEKAEVREAVFKRLGQMTIKLSDKLFGTINGKKVPLSADWAPGVIRIAMGVRNPMQKAMHEAMHEFFYRLNQEPAGKEMLAKLLKAANSASVVRQLERLLQDHPNAKMQILKGQPDYENERLAYMYQFWQANMLELGPETKTTFQKIMDFLRQLTGLLSNDQQVEKLLQAFDDGHFSDVSKTSVVAKILMKDMDKMGTFMRNAAKLAQGPMDVLKKVAYTAHGTLSSSGIPSLKYLADMFDVVQGERAADGKQGMYEARKQAASKFLNRMKNILNGVQLKDLQGALEALQREDGKGPKDMEQFRIYKELRKLLDDVYDYVDEAGVMRLEDDGNGGKKWVKVPRRENYFPVIHDIAGREAEFAADLVKYHSDEIAQRMKDLKLERWNEPERQMEYAMALANRLVMAHGAEDLDESSTALGFSPLMTAINERTLDWITHPEMMKYRNKDLVSTMTNYVMQATKRAEYVRRFENGGRVIKETMLAAYGEVVKKLADKEGADGAKVAAAMIKRYREITAGNQPTAIKQSVVGMTAEQLTDIETRALKEISKYQNAVMALEGTLGYDINPTLRELSGAMMVYQNFTKLLMTLFSSLSDPLGIMVRGGDFEDAYAAFHRGLKEVWKRWKDDNELDDATKLAEMIGSVDAGTFMESLGQTYSSLYLSGKTKYLNDQLFKWNGMEAWNRGMRVGATQAAIKFIKRHMTTPNKDSERYLTELFGYARPELLNGELNYADPLVQQAIMRWVDGAILSPNAAQRPVWASDPHWALFFHMKQFAYSFHKVILKRAWNEAVEHGNAAPIMTLIVGYVPMVIAADAVKAIVLSGGDEPYWMKQGVGSTIFHGADRANLLGIPQLGLDAFGRMFSKDGFDPLEGAASLAGPTTSWAKDWYDKPLGEQVVASLPGGNVLNQIGGKNPPESKPKSV